MWQLSRKAISGLDILADMAYGSLQLASPPLPSFWGETHFGDIKVILFIFFCERWQKGE